MSSRGGIALRQLVGLLVVGVLALVYGPIAGASARTGSAQGITKNEIEVVALVADLDAVRSKGFQLGPKLTTANLLKKWQAFADAYGPIHGREVVIKPAVWDPLDVTTFDRACTQATQDNKPFVVVNSGGFRQSAIGCITVANKTPFFYGENVYGDLQKASGNRLLSLGVAAEANAATAVSLVQKGNLVPKTSTIGILSANEPGIKAAADALEADLEGAGYRIAQKVEVNALSGDSAKINQESATAVATFKSSGVDVVFIVNAPLYTVGYYQEASRSNAGFKNVLLDAAAGTCTQFGAGRVPAEVVGTPCITTWDTRAVPGKNAVKPDSAFEAKCRKEFDAGLEEKTLPGVPSGDLVAAGVTYTEDMSPNECNVMSTLLPAIEGAGKNPTWAKVYANIVSAGRAPAAYMSNGEGSFTKRKPYFATQVHVENLQPVGATTSKDASGLFNGCPAPVNCWVPQLINGQEWFPVVLGR